MPFRLLHTSDWHVGRTIARHSRLAESRAVIERICELADEHGADAVVVSGDLFDQFHPSAEATRVVYHGLEELATAGLQVVLVAGNHDNPRRWDAVRPLLASRRIHVSEVFRTPDTGGRIVLQGADGSECELHLLPWIPEKELLTGEALMGLLAQAHQQYAHAMEQVIGGLCVKPEDPARPQVLVAHVFMAGARIGGGERQLTTGISYQVSAACLPAVLSYAALGHVHRAQRVSGAGPDAYYSGSPLQLDFSEAGQTKSVYLVDLEPGLRAEVTALELGVGRTLRELEGTLSDLETMRDEAGDAWLSVRLQCPRAEPGLADQVRELFPDAVRIVIVPEQTTAPERRDSLRGLTPREQFARYLGTLEPGEPDEKMLDLFEGLLTEIEAEEGAPAPA